VTFIGSSGIGMLVAIHHATNDAGMELQLDGVPPPVRRLLEITGLDGHFGVDSP
jgi:anti-anti-sigma factor